MSSEGLDEGDRYITRLLRLSALQFRRRVVRSLLAGNDTGCFSTAQYREAYGRQDAERWGDKCGPEAALRILDAICGPGWERKHLLGTGLVREVKPDVWAPRTEVGNEHVD